MTVFTEECLYMRPHLGYVRKRRVIEHVSHVRSDLGRHVRDLYTTPTGWVLCGQQDGKMGCAPACYEGSIQYEQHSLCQ